MRFIQSIKKRWQQHKKLIALYSDKDTVFIYQMGKVGSTSLAHSIPNAVHIHAFYTKNHTCPARLKGLAKFGWRYYIYRIEQELVAALLRKAFRDRKETKIITLVREPIKRNVSMFFHDLDAYLFAAHTNCLNTRVKPLPTRNQNQSLLTEVFDQEFDHQYPLTWFDEEMQSMTELRVYDTAFDKEKGFSIVSNQKYKLLCLRTDKIVQRGKEINDFIGEEVSIKMNNQAQKKWYGDLYKQFILDYKISGELDNLIKASRYYKHFFN